MNVNKDRLAGLVFLAFGALCYGVLIPYGIQKPPSVQYQALSPSYWPNFVAIAIGAIGLALTLTARGEAATDEATDSAAPPTSAWLKLRPFVALAICFALYFTVDYLGFVLGGAIALVCLMLLAGEIRPHIILPVALIVPLGLFVFFTKAASVPIPMGVLEPLLLRI